MRKRRKAGSHAFNKHPMHIVESALAGAEVVTVPFNIFQKIVKHPLTDKGLDAFLSDWKNSGRS